MTQTKKVYFMYCDVKNIPGCKVSQKFAEDDSNVEKRSLDSMNNL